MYGDFSPSATTGQKPANPCGVAAVDRAVGAQQVRLFHGADLDLDRGHQGDDCGERDRVRRQQGESDARGEDRVADERKDVGVTSSVLSLWSTPTRQDTPIACWAANVATIPIPATTSPMTRAPTLFSSGATIPSSCNSGPAKPSSSARANSAPRHHSTKPGRPLMPRKPVEPVRRYCSRLHSPHALSRSIREAREQPRPCHTLVRIEVTVQ